MADLPSNHIIDHLAQDPSVQVFLAQKSDRARLEAQPVKFEMVDIVLGLTRVQST